MGWGGWGGWEHDTQTFTSGCVVDLIVCQRGRIAQQGWGGDIQRLLRDRSAQRVSDQAASASPARQPNTSTMCWLSFVGLSLSLSVCVCVVVVLQSWYGCDEVRLPVDGAVEGWTATHVCQPTLTDTGICVCAFYCLPAVGVRGASSSVGRRASCRSAPSRTTSHTGKAVMLCTGWMDGWRPVACRDDIEQCHTDGTTLTGSFRDGKKHG